MSSKFTGKGSYLKHTSTTVKPSYFAETKDRKSNLKKTGKLRKKSLTFVRTMARIPYPIGFWPTPLLSGPLRNIWMIPEDKHTPLNAKSGHFLYYLVNAFV